MKAIVIKKPYEISIEDVNVPEISHNELLIKVKAVGICASEVHAFQGAHPFRIPPIISGHEFSGEVFKVGANVRGFSEGDRVTAFPIIACGSCEYCLSGKNNLCENRIVLGTSKWLGPFGEYIKAPETVVYKIPNDITYDEGALIEPLAVGFHTFKRANVKPDQTLAIFGAGAIGLSTLIIAKYFGTKTLVFEPVEFKANIAKKLGADIVANPILHDTKKILSEISIKGVDAAIDCAGAKSSLLNAIDMVKKDGRVVVTALFKEKIEIDPLAIMLKEINILGSNMYTSEEFKQTVSISSHVKDKLSQLITHKMNFEQANEAFKLMLENKAIRIILHP
ncbi:MAG: alcohol dehydrogenase catalytic domain-containing protein [Nitrososphaeria archaeon]